MKVMERMGLEGGLIEQVRIYTETRCRVRVGGEVSGSFWTEKGVRQGCPRSPTLFNIHVAELEDFLRRRQVGGLLVGGSARKYC